MGIFMNKSVSMSMGLSFISLMLMPLTPQAALQNTDANVEVVNVIQIIENVDPMNFGNVARPTTGSNTITLTLTSPSFATRSIGGGGDGALLPSDDIWPSNFQIIAYDGAVIDITIDNVTSPTGITFGSFTAASGGSPITFGAAAHVISGVSDNLDIGATMTVTPTAALGPQFGSYDLNVVYN